MLACTQQVDHKHDSEPSCHCLTFLRPYGELVSLSIQTDKSNLFSHQNFCIQLPTSDYAPMLSGVNIDAVTFHCVDELLSSTTTVFWLTFVTRPVTVALRRPVNDTISPTINERDA